MAQSWANHVPVNNASFDLCASLLQAVIEEWDSRPELSPCPSPILDAVPFGDLSDLSDLSDHLSDTSPLTSLPSSPVSSPSLPHRPLDISSLESKKGANNENNVAFAGEDDALAPGLKQAPLSRNAKRKLRRHAKNRAWRKKIRSEGRSAVDNHYAARVSATKKYVNVAAPIQTRFDTTKSPVASTAYVALDDHTRSTKVYALDDLVGKKSKFNFRLIKWDGREPMPVLDKDGRVVAILAGHPDDPNWASVHAEAAEALESRRDRVHVSKQKAQHRRGRFPALHCGVSHGGGQRRPGNLQNDPSNERILKELNELEPFRRFAGFASSVMATWTPDLHGYYTKAVDALHASDPTLQHQENRFWSQASLEKPVSFQSSQSTWVALGSSG